MYYFREFQFTHCNSIYFNRLIFTVLLNKDFTMTAISDKCTSSCPGEPILIDWKWGGKKGPRGYRTTEDFSNISLIWCPDCDEMVQKKHECCGLEIPCIFCKEMIGRHFMNSHLYLSCKSAVICDKCFYPEMKEHKCTSPIMVRVKYQNNKWRLHGTKETGSESDISELPVGKASIVTIGKSKLTVQHHVTRGCDDSTYYQLSLDDKYKSITIYGDLKGKGEGKGEGKEEAEWIWLAPISRVTTLSR
jgi:hypothetical protein